MSVEATYRRVSLVEFKELIANPGKALSVLNPFAEIDEGPEKIIARMEAEERDGRVFRLEKEWHALHFLLTGESDLNATSGVLPLFNVVLGGTPTPIEATYGMVRSLNPDEVREVAEALLKISAEELSRRFNAEQFNAMHIYPNPRPGGWDEEELQALLELYPRLVEFFTRAADAGEVVLLSSD